jgi:hypothetical protein
MARGLYSTGHGRAHNPHKILDVMLCWERRARSPFDPDYNNMRLLFPQVYLEQIAADHKMTLRRLLAIMHMHHLKGDDVVWLQNSWDNECVQLVDKVSR